MSTPLGDKMRTLAASLHPQAVDLVKAADEFDAAAEGFYGEPQTVSVKSFLGAYARARMLYCKLSGEPLV